MSLRFELPEGLVRPDTTAQLIEVDGIEYCATHGGIMAEGTDYHPDGLGCQYPESESDDLCDPVPLYWSPCSCPQSATYRQLDRNCPQHGDEAVRNKSRKSNR